MRKSEYNINVEVFYLQLVPKRCWQLVKQGPHLLKRNLPSFENVSVEQSLRKASIKKLNEDGNLSKYGINLKFLTQISGNKYLIFKRARPYQN
jgi:hypothetical protein